MPRDENNLNGLKRSLTRLELTISCASSSAFSFAIRSASLARLSLSFSEKIATDRALFTSFCLSRDFFAAISAARCSSSVVAFGTEGALAPEKSKHNFIKTNFEKVFSYSLVPACSVFSATFVQEGAGFNNSESELVPKSLETMQSVLR